MKLEETPSATGIIYGSSIYQMLSEVSQTSGKRKKEFRLKTFAATASPGELETFKRICKYAVDDFIRFGVQLPRNLASHPAGEMDVADPKVWEGLDRLRNTASSGNSAERTSRLLSLMDELNKPSFALVSAILEKDLGCGVGQKTIEKLFPGLLSIFNVMLAAKFEEKRLAGKWPVAVEPKYDGMRVLTRCTPSGSVACYTRSGREVEAMTGFHPMLEKLGRIIGSTHVDDTQDVWIDGEIITGNFNESISEARKSSQPIESGSYMVFDVIVGDLLADSDGALATKNGCYRDRRKRLEETFQALPPKIDAGLRIELAPAYYASSIDEVWFYYQAARAMNMEGVIVKNRDGLYLRKRNPNWMKIKAELTADLKVIGAFEGVGAIEGMLGGLIVAYNGVEVRVGSGFSLEQRAEFWKQFHADMDLIKAGCREESKLIDCLIEVQYQEVTPAGSLRHPVFVRLRKDKRDVSF